MNDQHQDQDHPGHPARAEAVEAETVRIEASGQDRLGSDRAEDDHGKLRADSGLSAEEAIARMRAAERHRESLPHHDEHDRGRPDAGYRR